MDILSKTAGTIKKFNMLEGGETVLVGLSGGPDSVCLLSVLSRLNLKLKLHALYIDHGLRPDETPKEMAFIKDLCEKMGVPSIVKTADVKSFAQSRGLNKQEAGRILRYAIFTDTALEIKGDRVALGHTLDDEVETFFMRILRGAGRKGLTAIPPVRGNIIRPLIEVERKDIEDFLRAEDIGYVVDSSNLKDDYLRNRLRFSLMPALRELSPSVMDVLSRTIDIFREEERYFDSAVTKALMKLITRKGKKHIELFLMPLTTLDRVILRRVLRRAIDETEGLRGMGFKNIEDVIGLIEAGKSGDRLYLPKGIRVVRLYSTLLMTSESPARLGDYSIAPGGQAIMKEAGALIKAEIEGEMPAEISKTMAVFDADRLSFPLAIRARRPGDFFYPSGFGHRKKIQDLFVDEKVPRDERDIVPLVLSGKDIIWVAGHRADGRFIASEKTKRFLVFEVKKINV